MLNTANWVTVTMKGNWNPGSFPIINGCRCGRV